MLSSLSSITPVRIYVKKGGREREREEGALDVCACERESIKAHIHVYVCVHACMYMKTLTIATCNISNLPDSNTMLLPGRVLGYKDTEVKLLPSSTTKHALWESYLQAAATSLMRAVAYTQLWRQPLPNVIVMKPMSDLCWVCQWNSTAIIRSSNHPEEEKSTVSTCTRISIYGGGY